MYWSYTGRMTTQKRAKTQLSAAIYARISHDPKKDNDDQKTDEPIRRGGDGLGVQRQEQDCRELAARLGYDIAHVFVDNDISAYSGKHRPGFEALLDAMKRS